MVNEYLRGLEALFLFFSLVFVQNFYLFSRKSILEIKFESESNFLFEFSDKQKNLQSNSNEKRDFVERGNMLGGDNV